MGDSPAARPLVLIVDDDADIREGVAGMLDDEGFATAQAANGADALNFLADAAESPDVILLDLMMPVLDGWTFCKLRQGIQQLMAVPVIAISAGSMVGDREPLRADATLSKPFDPNELTWLTSRMAGRRSFYPPRSGS